MCIYVLFCTFIFGKEIIIIILILNVKYVIKKKTNHYSLLHFDSLSYSQLSTNEHTELPHL